MALTAEKLDKQIQNTEAKLANIDTSVAKAQRIVDSAPQRRQLLEAQLAWNQARRAALTDDSVTVPPVPEDTADEPQFDEDDESRV